MNKEFSTKQFIKEGWYTTKKNIKSVIPVLLVAWLIQMIINLISSPTDSSFINFIIAIVTWVINLIVSIGLIHVSINLANQQQIQIKDLFTKKDKLIPYFLGTLFYSLIVIAGLFLLIIPGIIWAIRYQFYGYLIIDKNMSPKEALSKSKEITKNQTLNLIKLGLIMLAINILGFLALIFGLLISIPTSMVALALVYKHLLGETNQPNYFQNPKPPISAPNPNNMWATYRQNS